jgi:cobalt-precorrin-5B (C1)-methyltransferase
MEEDTFKPSGELRSGWTTGACATAAAKACTIALVRGKFEKSVTIQLPNGERPTFLLSRHDLKGGKACAGIIKDAGDDPDVTHGAEIIVTVMPGRQGDGITFHAGDGVGTVSLPGLTIPVGEPAINPAPRKMICEVIQAVASTHDQAVDFEVTISIPGGKILAKKTMNGRLGIMGGLSVLGTTGIVRPYSCSAWIHSIHRGIDVARATGLSHVAAATGKTSEAAVKELYQLDPTALIDMGDFAGGVLKYLRHHPLKKLTLAGGFGKLTKLAQGHMDLHSARSELDFNKLASCLDELGARGETQQLAKNAITAKAVLDLAQSENLELANLIAVRAQKKALEALDGEVEIEVCIFDRDGQLVGRAND